VPERSLENPFIEFARNASRTMERNGFQRHCVGRGDVTEDDIKGYRQELEKARNERPLQEYFTNHKWMLPQQLSAGCRWVIPLPRLGSEYVPDFAVARLDSTGVEWTLVELESPRARLFVKSGRPSEKLDEGMRQINYWRAWLEDNIDYARRDVVKNGLGLMDITRKASGLVLIGRRANRTNRDRQLMQTYSFDHRIEIHSYDWVIDEAHGRIKYHEAVQSSGEDVCEDCLMPLQ
jgi:hypothetical protein